jgi:DNA-binding NarL/FixJ family response regulator
MIRIIVADDHPVPRAGIVQTISQDASIKVIGEASDGPEVWALLEERVPDVLLLDFNMPGFRAIQEVPDLLEHFPEMKILIVTAYSDEEYVRSLAEAGVDGYLLKDADADIFIEAVHDVAAGRTYFSSEIRHLLTGKGPDKPKLTAQEKAVLRLAGQGLTSDENARNLTISSSTVNFHVRNARYKLNAHSRTEAAVKALEMGLLKDEENR